MSEALSYSDAYVQELDEDGKPIWRQVLIFLDGKWVKPEDIIGKEAIFGERP